MDKADYKGYTLELFKDMYYHQIDQRDKINSRINVPLTIFTALVGGTLYFITNFKDSSAYIILLIIYIESLIITAICFFKSYYNYKYQYLPRPDVINVYIQNIKVFYEDNYKNYFESKNISQNEYILDKLNMFLINASVEAASTNTESNLRKIASIRQAGIALILNILLFLVLFFLNINL